MSKRKTKTKAQKRKRKVKFQQSQNFKKNQAKKMQDAYMNHLNERQEVMKRANIIEQIYKAKPEIGKVIDGVLQVNEEVVVEKDEVLYWAKDDNPIMAGLEAFENYSKYSKDFVNQVLGVIQQHEAQKAQESPQTTEVDLEGFDLVEDDSFDFEVVEDEDVVVEDSATEETKEETKEETSEESAE